MQKENKNNEKKNYSKFKLGLSLTLVFGGLFIMILPIVEFIFISFYKIIEFFVSNYTSYLILRNILVIIIVIYSSIIAILIFQKANGKCDNSLTSIGIVNFRGGYF